MPKNDRLRKPGELEGKFKNQMNHLVNSCRAFDFGQENEAERISVTLRILLHTHGKSQSVFTQLNLLKKLEFVDSGVRRELFNQAQNNSLKDQNLTLAGNWPSDTGLVIPGFDIKGKGKFVAPLVRNRYSVDSPIHSCIVPKRPFHDWWETPFIESSTGYTFSRKDIVMTMADQDGGAHIDPMIDANFSDFCQDYQGAEFGPDSENLSPAEANIVHASIRQIAFEVMSTLDDYLKSDWVMKTANGVTRKNVMILPFQFTLVGEEADDD